MLVPTQLPTGGVLGCVATVQGHGADWVAAVWELV